MPKPLWFIAGFMAALLLGAVLVLGPLEDASAGENASSAPTLWPTSEPSLAPTAQLAETPMPATLLWGREGEKPGQCDQLLIDAANQVHYSPCAEGSRLAYLIADEMRDYAAYVQRYASFYYAVQEPSGFSAATIHLSFPGRGSIQPDDARQAEIARWASAVYERLRGQELRSDLVARARLHLAQQLNVAADALTTLSVEQVTWPDACVGLRVEGAFCAQVLTPGYRIVIESQGRAYEYRTDLRETVRLVDDANRHMVLPPLPTPSSG